MMHKVEHRRLIVDMNLIPLIDVSLILVIIFMILTPVLVQSHLSVKLPSAVAGAPVPVESTIRVQIGASGQLTVDGRDIRLSQLDKELTLRMSQASSKTVLVQADRSVSIEKVVQVFDAAKRLGAGKMGIAVIPEP